MTGKTDSRTDDTEAGVETTLEMSESLADSAPRPDRDGSESIRYETMPTVRPVLVMLGVVLAAGVGSIGLLAIAPAIVGGAALAEIIGSAIAILVTIVAARLLIKIAVLSRTRYTIREDAFQREYELFYRSQSREIPVEKLRGHEYTQSRIQSFLGFGTVRLLTAGTNRSLGFIEFEHLDDPERVRHVVRTLSNADE